MDNGSAIAKLRANFEGKQAIYLEKGALLVCVSDIRPGRTTVAAQIEEIPTSGLLGFVGVGRPNGQAPLRWTIRAGSFSVFSDHCWQMGYGGWSIHFEPALVRAVVQLAAEFPETLDDYERYRQIRRRVQEDPPGVQGAWQKVFPTDEG